jgi:hypothetical protein
MIGLVALLAACSNQDVIPETEATPVMVTSGDSATVTELDGSTVSGVISVFVESHPRITDVSFYLDDSERTGEPLASFQTAPYEVEIDTTLLENGPHTVTTLVSSSRGKNNTQTVEHARILVDNQVAEAPDLVVTVGEDHTITLPATASLAGSVSTDGTAYTATWSLATGPGTVTFSEPESLATSATFEVAGMYDIVLTANSGDLQATDQLTVTVLEQTDPEPTEPAESTTAVLDMRGDPNFSDTQLSSDARLWYMRFLAAVENPNQYQNATSMAISGDLYTYARPLNAYLTTVLTVFRATGDLRLLDEVDRIAELMRAELRDSWEGTLDGTDGTSDGYLNWRFLADGGERYTGKDTHLMDEILTHSAVAGFTWAFENNRDLASPSGINYAERADFWYDYLKNHFEAKWRSGAPYESIPWSNGQFVSDKNIAHPYIQGTRIYHYMDKLMQRRGEPNHDGSTYNGLYAQAAQQQTDTAMDTPRVDGSIAGGLYGHGPIDTSMGKSLIIPFGLPFSGSTVGLQALNTTYVRYVHGAIQDLHLDGAYRWEEQGENGTIARLAVNLAYFIMDTDPIAGVERPFAQDSVGGQTGWPIPHDEIGYRTRVSADKYAISQFALTLAFSPNQQVHDKIASINQQVYDQVESDLENPRRIFIPAGMFLDAVLN